MPLRSGRRKLLNQERKKGIFVKNSLAWLALCAAPLLVQAQDNCTSPNSNDDYILGTADGTASAMHWPTGLVWKRCVEGMTYSSGQCTGTPTSNKWPNWATSYLPKYFTDSGPYPHSAPSTQNLLASGASLPTLRTVVMIVFVALDGVEGSPVPVPGWTPTTDEDRRLAEYALQVMALSKGIEETVARYREAGRPD